MMKLHRIALLALSLLGAPALADSIGGVTLGMSREDARTALSSYGKVIESPEVKSGLGKGASSLDAGRYSAILCDDKVSFISRRIDADFVTFADKAHRKQELLDRATDANAVSSGGKFPLSAIYLTWVRPDDTRYILSYQKAEFFEIVVETLSQDLAKLCIPIGPIH